MGGTEPSVEAVPRVRETASSAITVRDATLADCDDIVRIWREGCMNSSGLPPPLLHEATQAFSNRLVAPSSLSRIWVAVADDTTIGWQGLAMGGGTQILPVAQSSTYIDRAWQTKGVGRLLLTHAQDQAPSMGLWAIIGWIKTDNFASIALVTSLGWVLMGPLPSSTKERPHYLYYAYAVPSSVQVPKSPAEISG